MNRRSFLGSSATTLLLSLGANFSFASSSFAQAFKAQIGDFGLDLAGRDLSVKAGDDFFEYAGGNWLKTNSIPNDRARWGVFDELRAKSEKDVKDIIDEISTKSYPQGTIEQKIGDFYRAYMDTDTINKKGIEPIKGELAIIQSAKNYDDIAKIMASPSIPTESPISWGVNVDDGNPDRYILNIYHSGLGLPDRDYYLKSDARMKELQKQYPIYIEKMLNLAGISDAKNKAQNIMALETKIAKLHWPIEDNRDSTKLYNLRKVADLPKIAPDFPWQAALNESGYGNVSEVIVGQLSAMKPLGALYKSTPINIWQDYLSFHLISSSASLLPVEFDDAYFEFYGKTMNGQKEKRARWKRGTYAIDDSLGEAIGQIYVKRHFSANAKSKMLELVNNLRRAFYIRIKNVSWMSEETKQTAYKKLETFNPKIGYPNKWKDYSSLEIKADDAIGNSRRSMVFEHSLDIARLNKKTDRDEWFMTPQTVNAYYNPVFNEIVFPAAILQPPFFDENADMAVNYGGIGGVIGHEMGHGFDDQGAKYDEKGVLRDWWKPSDVKAFNALGNKMVAQYGKFEPLPGVKLNGRLTLGENIGDHCGITMGYYAYHIALNGKEAPVLDGLTGDQRFFLSWGQVWRTLSRDEALRNQIQSDPHSPAKYRVNGTLQNFDYWYSAFNVTPDQKLYVAPQNRVRIW